MRSLLKILIVLGFTVLAYFYIWFLASYSHIKALTVLGFIGLASFFLWLWAFRSQKILQKSRPGWGKKEFLDYFLDRQIPENFASIVYDYLCSRALVDNFPVHPTDSVSRVYGICEEDFVDAVFELSQYLGIDLSRLQENKTNLINETTSVEELIIWLFLVDVDRNTN